MQINMCATFDDMVGNLKGSLTNPSKVALVIVNRGGGELGVYGRGLGGWQSE